MTLLDFKPCLAATIFVPPSLCEQSELQCFASELRRMFAQRRLLLCRNRNVIWSKIVQNFLYFEHPTREDIAD